MVQPDSNILQHKDEVLEKMNAAGRTHGKEIWVRDADGSEVVDEEDDGEDAGGVRGAFWSARTLFVIR